MKKPIFTGSGVAIVTPMYDDGSVNFDVLAQLIEFHIENKTDAIIICGTTGEASALDDDEHLQAIEFTAKTVAKRIPVVAGTGGNDTRHAINLSKEAVKRGADALLLVTPYYNKTNQSGLIEHFNCIINAAGAPSILYNVPSRTAMTIKPETYKELSKNPLVIATKEASGDISAIAQTAALCGDDLQIYTGNDDQILPILALGGIGVISVFANIAPKQTHDIVSLYLEGKIKESLDLQLKNIELINAMFSDVNPIPVKAALKMMGYAVGDCRLPLGKMSEKGLIDLENVMKKYKFI